MFLNAYDIENSKKKRFRKPLNPSGNTLGKIQANVLGNPPIQAATLWKKASKCFGKLSFLNAYGIQNSKQKRFRKSSNPSGNALGKIQLNAFGNPQIQGETLWEKSK